MSGGEAGIMRKSITALVAAAAITVAVVAQPKPAEARCWGCWVSGSVAVGVVGGAVFPGWSHAYSYGSIYGPYFAYPAYSEYGYGFAPYGYAVPVYYTPPPAYYAAPAYQPPLYAHHYYHHTYRHHCCW
jgi:hypothetical protein